MDEIYEKIQIEGEAVDGFRQSEGDMIAVIFTDGSEIEVTLEALLDDWQLHISKV